MRARQVYPSNVYKTYTFSYSGGRLSAIANTIGTSEGYGFTYGSQTLTSPFGDGASFGTVGKLTGVSLTGLNLSYALAADTGGQLTQVTFAYGGYLKWHLSGILHWCGCGGSGGIRTTMWWWRWRRRAGGEEGVYGGSGCG